VVVRLEPTVAIMKATANSGELMGRQKRNLLRTPISKTTNSSHVVTTPQEKDVNTRGEEYRT